MIEELESYYTANFDKLVSYYSHRTGNISDAEDVVQEAFYRAIRYQESYSEHARDFETWFFTIARRAFYDLKRDRLKMGMTTLMEEALVEDTVDMDGYEQKLAGEIEELINQKKDPEHRSILYLYFIRNYKPSDIVNVVDTSNATIRQIVWRFKQEVKDRYEYRSAETNS